MCAWLQGRVSDDKVGRTHEDNAVGNNPTSHLLNSFSFYQATKFMFSVEDFSTVSLLLPSVAKLVKQCVAQI